MYCGNCGKEIESDSVYCRHCDSKVGAADPKRPPTGLYYAEDKSVPGGAALAFSSPLSALSSGLCGRISTESAPRPAERALWRE